MRVIFDCLTKETRIEPVPARLQNTPETVPPFEERVTAQEDKIRAIVQEELTKERTR